MRKLLTVTLIAVSLSGCAGLKLITSSAGNPVTPDVLYQVENTITVAFAGLNAYRRACVLNAVDLRCRENIRAIQPFTRKIPPLLTQLRTFVRVNDQVNAVVVYNELVQLVSNLKSLADAKGIQIGAVQ